MLTGFVNTEVNAALTSTNASLANQKFKASVSELPLQFWSPYRLPTTYTNRPNEWYVTLPMIVGIQVHIPDWFDRQVFVPLNLNVYCDGWYTGSGVIKIDAVPGPPSFEGGSWLEDAPGLSLIRDYVNSLVRANFNVPPVLHQTYDQLKCDALGVLPGQGLNDKFAAIIYDKPPATGPKHGTVAGELFEPQLTVTYLALKRLMARDAHNNILYAATENIFLETYAEYTTRSTQTLTMKENDQATLTMAPVVLHAPFLDPLVIIANIRQQSGVEDSAFGIWPQALNFSPGAHTLTVTKTYVVPPGTLPNQTKPQFVQVPAYELDYMVQYRGNPEVISHPN